MTGLERKMNRTMDRLVGSLKKPAGEVITSESMERKAIMSSCQEDFPEDSEIAVKSSEFTHAAITETEHFHKRAIAGDSK
ncbi:MAG TPA: hypothetical protein VN631_15580 [Negativicutes bacterium]|nr:hypothetical protein [Negativicutes bacterium]